MLLVWRAPGPLSNLRRYTRTVGWVEQPGSGAACILVAVHTFDEEELIDISLHTQRQ